MAVVVLVQGRSMALSSEQLSVMANLRAMWLRNLAVVLRRRNKLMAALQVTPLQRSCYSSSDS